MPKYLTLPNGASFPIADGESPEQATAVALQKYPEAFGFPGTAAEEQPQSGFGAAFGSGLQRLKGDIALGAGKLGALSPEAATKYQQERDAEAQRIFKPGAESFTDAPWDYTKELLGQSIPYALAPLAAAGIGAVAGAPAAIGAGAGLAASGAQFFGSNLRTQMEQGKTLEETSGARAGTAAVGQAALEALTFRAIPGIGRLFGAAGAPITKEAATKLADQTVKQVAADITAATGKAATVGAITETLQQVLERLQADMSVTDPEARAELLQSAFGGALLSGVLAPGGRAFERRGARKEGERLTAEEKRVAAEQAAAAERVAAEKAAADKAALDAAAAERGVVEANPREMGPTRQIGGQRQVPGVDAVEQEAPAEPLTPEEVQQKGSELLQRKQYFERLLSDKDALYEREASALAQGDFAAAAQAAKFRKDAAAQVAAIDGELQAIGYTDYTKRSSEIGAQLAKVEAQLRAQADPGVFDPARVDALQKKREALLAEAQKTGAQGSMQPDMFGTINVTGKSVQRNVDADIKALGARIGSEREAAAQQRTAADAQAKQQREAAAAEAARAQDEAEWLAAQQAVAQEQAVGAEVTDMERLAGTNEAPAVQQPRLFGEPQGSARVARGAGSTSERSEAQVLADISIARATRDRQEMARLVEALRDVRDARKQRDADGRSAEPFGSDLRNKELERAAGMKVPAATAQRQALTDARAGSFAQLVSTLERFNRGAADADTMATATKGVADNLVREIESISGTQLAAADRQDVLREVRELTNELRVRFGDTRGEVNVGTRKEPDFEPVQKRSGAFRTDLPGAGAGATGMGLENLESRRTGDRTFGSRFAAAQSIAETLDNVRNRFTGAQESAPGVDRTDSTQSQQDRLRTAQRLARGTAAEALVQRVVDERVQTPELVDATVQAAMRAQRGQDIGEQQRTINDELARLEQGKRSETEGAATAIQADMFGGTGTMFGSYKEFEAYLAGDALAALKLANGNMRDSIQRTVRLVAPMQKQIAALEQQVAALAAKRQTLENTSNTERAAASKQVADAEAALLKAQEDADFAVSEYRTALVEAEANLRSAHEEHAQLAREIADNVAALENTIVSEKPLPALVKAKKDLRDATADIAKNREKMATLMRSMATIADLSGSKVAQYAALQEALDAGTKRAVQAHTQLMAASRQQSAARDAAPTDAFLNFLLVDGELTAQRKGLLSRIGGLTTARNRAQQRYDAAVAQAAADPAIGGRVEARRTEAALARSIRSDVETRANQRAGEIRGLTEQMGVAGAAIPALRAQSTGATARAQQRGNQPTTAETQGAREARDGARRREEQQLLETRQEAPGTTRESISFEARRRDREAMEEAGTRMRNLEEVLSRVPMTPEQRAEFDDAQVEYAGRVAALEKRAGARTAGVEGKLNAQKKRVEALQKAQADLAAAKEGTSAYDKAEARVQRLTADIRTQGAKIAKTQGITRTILLSKAEQRVQDARRDTAMRINDDLDAFALYTERQSAQRATSPATRETRQTGSFRTGVAETAEQRAGGQRSRIIESRLANERNVTMSAAEMAEANAEALRAASAAKEMRDANAAAAAEAAKTTAQKEADLKKARAEALALAKALDTEALLRGKPPKSAKPPSRLQSIIDAVESDDWDDNAYRSSDTVYAKRDVKDLDADTQTAVKDGRILDALDLIAARGSTPFVRDVAARVRPLVMRTKLRVQSGLKDADGAPAEGLYTAGTNSITMDSMALTEEAFLHEAVHAATLRALDADPATLTPEQRAARQELEALLNGIRADRRFNDQYGRKDVGELAAEVLSNPDLRAKMDDQSNVLRRLYDAFLRLIGMPRKTVSETAVRNVYALFQPSKAYTRPNPAAVASIVRGVFPGSGPKFDSDVPASVQAMLTGTVGREPSVADKITANISGLAFRTQFLDRFAPVEQLLRAGVERGTLDSVQAFQTSYFLRFGEQRNQFVEQAATMGVPQMRRNADGDFMIETPEGTLPNLARIGNELRNANAGNERAAEQMFTTYLAVLRAEKVGFDKLNFDEKITPAQAQDLKRYVAADPQRAAAFERARGMYREYNNQLLNLLVQTDAMSTAEAQRLKQGDYVPYYREDAEGVVNLIVAGEQPVRIGNIKDQPYLRELVGGNDKILPFFSGAMQNTSMLMDMALRNQQTKDVAMTLSKMGVAKIGRGLGPNDKRNVVHFKINGEHHFGVITDAIDEYGVPADLLVKGLEGIKTTLPAALRVMQWPTNILRKMVTRAPAYAVRQLLREPLNAWMVTGGNFTPVVSSVKELAKILQNKSPAALALERAGAVSSNVITGDAQDQARILRDLAQDKNGWRKTMMAADKFAMNGDTATRAVVYDTYRKKGLTHMQATLGTLELMNFGRRGLSPSMQAMSMLVPFFNAQVQGLDVIYRAARGTTSLEKKMDVQRKLAQRGALMAAATLAYVAAMQDDDAYKNATPEQRALSWFLPLPGLDEPLRVPIPFELGYAFKALPELMFNVALNDTKAEDAALAFGKLAYQTVPIGLPQAVKPYLEVITNHSFFTGDDVETVGERRVAPEERFRSNTTELVKALGRGTGVSPVQIEHLIRGYTGGLGLTVVGLASLALRPLTTDENTPDGPTKRMSEMPLLGPLFQPADGRGVINEAYKDIESWQQAQATFNKMLREGRRADALQFAQKHSTELAMNTVGGAYRQQMGELAAVRKVIMADASMAPAEKRLRIDQIRQVELELARRVRAVSAQAS